MVILTRRDGTHAADRKKYKEKGKSDKFDDRVHMVNLVTWIIAMVRP